MLKNTKWCLCLSFIFGTIFGLLIGVFKTNSDYIFFKNIDGKFDMSILWTAIGAISTSIAVILALFQDRIKRRKNLKIFCEFIVAADSKIKESCIIIDIFNKCENQIKIENISLLILGKKCSIDRDININFPYILEPYHKIEVIVRYEKIIQIFSFISYNKNNKNLLLTKNRHPKVEILDWQGSRYFANSDFTLDDFLSNGLYIQEKLNGFKKGSQEKECSH